MRVVGFFVYCFASLLVPIGLGFGLMVLRAPPFRVVEQKAAIESGSFVSLEELFGETTVDRLGDLRAEHPSSLAAAGAVYRDSTLAVVIAYEDARLARGAASALVGRIPTSAQSSGPGGVRYTRSDTRARGLVRHLDKHVVWVQGPTRELVDSRYSALPGIERNPDTNFANVILDDNSGAFVGAVLLWVLLQVLIWPRYASSAATARASAERKRNPANTGELRTLLTAIGNPDSPIRTRQTEREDEILVEWRYDSGKWSSLMAAGRVRQLRRIRLRLDEKLYRVLARDEQSEVSWEVGAGGAASSAELKWKAMRGIAFAQYERTAQYGLILEDGLPRFGEHYSFEFNVKELRAPVIAITNDSGWDYRPVVAFNRLFGG